jgi:hypothetical protein
MQLRSRSIVRTVSEEGELSFSSRATIMERVRRQATGFEGCCWADRNETTGGISRLNTKYSTNTNRSLTRSTRIVSSTMVRPTEYQPGCEFISL